MDFAKKQLEKYGWKEGEGLGRNKSGIPKPIKPKLKFDTGGLGHDIFEDINNTWWQRLYDEAARNIVTKKNKNDSDAVVLETVENSIVITTKKRKWKKHKKEKYENFVKTAELNRNVEKRVIESVIEPEVKKEKITSGICDLTDEELFRVCAGRTAHKGARHGLNMKAKLTRIEEQERNFGVNKCDEEVEGTKIRKNKKKKKRNKTEI